MKTTVNCLSHCLFKPVKQQCFPHIDSSLLLDIDIFFKLKPYFSAFQILLLFLFLFFFSVFNKGVKIFGVVHVATGIRNLRFMHLKPQTPKHV